MHKVFLPVLLLLPVLSLVIGVSAQSKNGTVSATVLDQHKALLRGASVTLTNVDTKAVQKCVSNEKGECRFEVPAGAYELTTDLDRFCSLKVSDIRLKENETVPIDLKLEPVIWKNPGPEYENLLKARGF
jgi:hypothetical protein